MAERFDNGHYRIYGRSTDCFIHGGINYPMYDIEEKVLEHPYVAEAEVIKFAINKEEYPAIVVVLTENSAANIPQVLEDLYKLDVAGMEHLIGIRFVDKFKTNPITGKRDYFSLQNDKDGYLSFKEEAIFVTAVGEESKKADTTDITIINIQ